MNRTKKVVLSLLVAASVVLAGCATFRATSPNATPADQQAKLVELDKIAGIALKVVTVAEEVQLTEIALYNAGQVPKEQHLAIQNVFLKFAQAVQANVSVAKDVTRPYATRLDAVNAIIDAVAQLSQDFNTKYQISDAVRLQLKMGIQVAVGLVEAIKVFM